MANSGIIAAQGRPVRIFNVYEGVPQFHLQNINEILDRVGDRPVAIISVNGAARTGKSFLLNLFLRQSQLRANPEMANVDIDGFAWRGGRERTTVGIWMWSEPIPLVDKSGREIGVILMDTQGSFDAHTDFRFNALIFCISLWLSSVFIYNTKSELSEDKLQFFEYFTSFANDFDDERESAATDVFQKCVILIRDWQNATDNQYGVHRRRPLTTVDGSVEWIYEPAMDNFFHHSLVSMVGFSDEALETRRAMRESFSDISFCLLPHPGKAITTSSTNATAFADMDPEFRLHVERFIDSILDSGSIEPRKLHGVVQSGYSFQPIVSKWAELVHDERVPEARQLSSATAEIQLVMLLHRVQKAFDARLETIRDSSSSRDDFLTTFHDLFKRCRQSYTSRSVKFAKHEKKLNFTSHLETYMVEQKDSCLTIIDLAMANKELAEKRNAFQGEREKNQGYIQVLESHLAEQKRMLEATLADESRALEAELVKKYIRQGESDLQELRRKNERLEAELKKRQTDIDNQLKDFGLILKLGRKEFKRLKGITEGDRVTKRSGKSSSKCFLS